jgi:hypothetical protein
MVWSPLAGGLLSGKYALGRRQQTEGEGRRAKLDFPRVEKALAFDLVEAMRPMAESRGVAVSAIAIAWLLHQDVVSTVIVGARRSDQLAENLAASEVELTAAELARLDALGAPGPNIPAGRSPRRSRATVSAFRRAETAVKLTGLLGGSFNPAHGAHRAITLFAIEALGLDEAWWLVSPGNPLKPARGWRRCKRGSARRARWRAGRRSASPRSSASSAPSTRSTPCARSSAAFRAAASCG